MSASSSSVGERGVVASKRSHAAAEDASDNDNDPLQAEIDTELRTAFAKLDMDDIERTYLDQDEFVFIENALPLSFIEPLVDEFEGLREDVHRSWIPRARKAGTVGYGAIQALAPRMDAIYKSQVIVDLLKRFSKKDLVLKDDDDQHACALYAYNKKGDGIDYHYDTCGCELGASYAMIIGLIDNSSCRFEADLYKRTKTRPVRHVGYKTPPGSMLLFCGDNVWHAATPVRANEERIVMCASYVTDGKQVRGVKRFTENIRDAFFYFGLPAVFQRNYHKRKKPKQPKQP